MLYGPYPQELFIFSLFPRGSFLPFPSYCLLPYLSSHHCLHGSWGLSPGTRAWDTLSIPGLFRGYLRCRWDLANPASFHHEVTEATFFPSAQWRLASLQEFSLGQLARARAHLSLCALQKGQPGTGNRDMRGKVQSRPSVSVSHQKKWGVGEGKGRGGERAQEPAACSGVSCRPVT